MQRKTVRKNKNSTERPSENPFSDGLNLNFPQHSPFMYLSMHRPIQKQADTDQLSDFYTPQPGQPENGGYLAVCRKGEIPFEPYDPDGYSDNED
ncbi:hypothetical protein [Kingella potus]|uniref:hypothetical protein n=1 Tax=Kingella potus TaxID=265175 RepID=UPI001FD3EF11|nr:hypothetical protein [Kingella potus]UOO99884.1 hypothetical protein LVJ84_07320 [Kingella potus]